MKPVIIIIMIWLFLSITSAGLSNATFGKGYHWIEKSTCERWARRDLAFSLGIGLVGGPFSLAVALVMSGFGYDGWTLQLHKCEGYD